MKLDQYDVTRIWKLVVDHDMDSGSVAEQFDLNWWRVQLLAKQYRESGEIPELDTLGRTPYGEYLADREERIPELYQHLWSGAEAISYVVRVLGGLSIATNRVHAILQEYDNVTENSN